MHKLILAIALIVACIAVPLKGHGFQYRDVSISLPRFELKPSEEIESFRCDLGGDMIARMTIPLGWNLEIENGAFPVSIEAHIEVGVAAFRQNELSYFKDFLTVHQQIGTPLDIKITLNVNDFPTGEMVRSISFSTKDLIVQSDR